MTPPRFPLQRSSRAKSAAQLVAPLSDPLRRGAGSFAGNELSVENWFFPLQPFDSLRLPSYRTFLHDFAHYPKSLGPARTLRQGGGCPARGGGSPRSALTDRLTAALVWGEKGVRNSYTWVLGDEWDFLNT